MLQISKRNVILFNGAAALLIVGSFGYALKTTFISDSIPPCSSAERVGSERYPRGMQMALENGGRLLTSADLQARALGTDWGLIERTKISRIADGPAKVAIEYTVTNKMAGDRVEAAGREGAGFVWAPRALRTAKSACLAYSMFVPEGFDFAAGGRLPGFMGEAKTKEGEEQGQSFQAMPNWDSVGAVGPAVLIGIADGSNGWNRFGAFAMTRGRWVSIEQEIVMNTPGERDGIVRTWVNGSLAVDARTAFNATEPVNLTGVLAEVSATGVPQNAKAKTQQISVTPFIVYLN